MRNLSTRIIVPVLWGILASMVFPCAAADDGAITRTVKKAIAYDDAVHLDGIKTMTSNGVVTLVGTVDNLLARQRATRIAERVRGVRAVVTRLELKSPKRADEAVQNDLNAAFAQDPVIDTENVTASIQDGRVTLQGEVPSQAVVEWAYYVAAGIAGVRDVDSQLKVQPVESRPDDELAKEARARLAASVQVDSERLSVSVKDGKVSLSGEVATLQQRRSAFTLAYLPGVEIVDVSGVEVRPTLQVGVGQRSAEAKNDYEIRQAVIRALEYDPRVDASQVAVTVEDGLVQLAGHVGTPQAKRAAIQDANNTVGVWQVQEEIVVKSTREVPAATLAETVQAALRRDAYLSADKIRVSVEGSQVTLQGQVTTLTRKRRASRVVNGIQGVSYVRNELDVENLQDAGPFDPLTLKYRIHNRFFWSPLVDDEKVTVVVDDDGVATLTGFVRTKLGFRAATRMARDAGAKKVVNRLLVRNDLPLTD